MLKLYDYFRSSACFRVRIALLQKGLDFDVIPVHLLNDGGEQFSASYRDLNPQSLVPTLESDGRVLTQSLAIIEYLDELYPSVPLLPKDPYLKALTRSVALAITADIHPLNNLRVLRYLQNEFELTEDDKLTWYKHWLKLGLDALEQTLTSQSNQTTFCFTDFPTIADICLVPQLYNARRFSFDLAPYPRLLAIESACQKLDSFKQACPQEAVT